MPSVYLDWNATTPVRIVASEAWLECQQRVWGNPSSTHRPGQAAKAAWLRCCDQLAALLHCRPHELIATASGTEAIALAIHASLHAAVEPVQVLATRIEHSAVLRNLERHPQAQVSLLDVDAGGRVSEESLCRALDEQVALVCIQLANNELGTVQELASLIPLIRAQAPQARVLVDACQGAGKTGLDFQAMDADFCAIAGHKFGAPRGTGLLLARTGVPVPPAISGGKQQDDRRSGTEDLAGLEALTAALAEAMREQERECARQQQLLQDCFAAIQAALPAVVWLGAAPSRLANTMNLAYPGVHNRALVTRLDLAGFAVSVGSACMARRDEPSHVIAALAIDAALKRGAIRVSIGRDTNADELQAFAKAYVAEVAAMTG